MHRIETRSYVGESREVVTVTTRVTGGGQAAVIVDGVDMGQQADFALPDNPGDRIQWQIALTGPLGATCVIGIAVVDGTADGDFLICQPHNPAPVHFYTCSAIQAPAMRELRRIRGAKVARKAPTRRTAAKKRSTKTVTRKTAARKKAASTTTSNQRSAARTSKKKPPGKRGR